MNCLYDESKALRALGVLDAHWKGVIGHDGPVWNSNYSRLGGYDAWDARPPFIPNVQY